MDETTIPTADLPPLVHTYDLQPGGPGVPVPVETASDVTPTLLATAEASETTPRRCRSDLPATTEDAMTPIATMSL
eukprot:2196224-Heterocapsa_arctica.AAC.1